MRKSLVVAASLSCAFAAVVACSNKPAVAPTPSADAGPVADAAPAAASDAAGVGLAPVGDAGPVYPTFFTGDAGGTTPTTPTTPALTDQALDMAIDVAISAMASKVAPKMGPEGQPGRATLKDGEHWGMVVNLQPMRCYTFVGFSPPGQVAQLDLHLYQMPLNVEAGKSGATDKAAPVMGKGAAPICPISPIALPYKLDVVATKGHGRMGVYVYSRAK